MPKRKRAGDDAITRPVPVLVEFLLDETGSMQSHLWPTINGFNDFIEEQKKQDGLCLFTLTKFDTSGLKTPYLDLDVSMVPSLTDQTFVPGSLTNLRDAIMSRIEATRSRVATWDIKPRVLFVCTTDGGDNASEVSETETRRSVIAAEEDGWTMLYLGAFKGAAVIGQALGFRDGNIRCFEATEMRKGMRDLAQATTAYRTAAAPTDNFFATI